MRRFFLVSLLVSTALCGAVLVCAQEGKAVALTTSDNWIISATYKAADRDKKTILLLPDLNQTKKSFTTLSQALEREGYGYLVLDFRGQGQSQNLGPAKQFAKEGVDNDFNKMTRDVDAAMQYLQKQGVPVRQIVFLGVGLGANVAAKSVSFWPEAAGLALFTPTANNKDVLSIPALRIYKGTVLIGSSAADKKLFLEASVIRNVSFLTTGEGRVTFLTAYNLTAHGALDKYFIPALLQWLQTPSRPALRPDAPTHTSPMADPLVPAASATAPVPPSTTEESLFPSVLL